MDHCEELQPFIVDLKISMEKAMNTLSSIQGDDSALKDKIESIETKCRQDTTEIMALIDGLRNELGAVVENVRQVQTQQREIDQRISDFLHRSKFDQANKKRISTRRSRSADAMAADHDSGIHSTNGGVLTDQSSSPPSGRASPTGHIDCVNEDIVNQNRILTSKVRRQLFPSYSSPLLCIELSDKDSDDSDVETKVVAIDRLQCMRQAIAGKSSAHRRLIRKVSQQDQCQPGRVRADQIIEHDDGRYRILAEIVNTEKLYCNRLWYLQANIYEPLKEENLISQKDLNILFPHELKLIYEQHCVLLHKLETRLSCWSPDLATSIAALFRPQFDSRSYLACIYADYAGSFSKITDAFKENFLKNSDVIKFLKSRSASQQAKETATDLRLDTFLTLPLERVSYYIRALKKFLSFPQSDTDQQSVTCLVENLQDLATEINNCIKSSLASNSGESSADRGDQSDSSTGREMKKRYSKKATDASIVVRRNDSAARRARSAAAVIKKQMQQPQLASVEEHYTVDQIASNQIPARRVSNPDWTSDQWAQTFPKRQAPQAPEKEIQESFLTFGRCDPTLGNKSPSTGFLTVSARKTAARSMRSENSSNLEKSKQEICQDEPVLSRATSISTESSGSPLQSLEEPNRASMPITITASRRESSPIPMPMLKERSRQYPRGNVVPIRYTRTVDFHTWVNENGDVDRANFRSASMSPSRSASIKGAQTDHGTNDASSTRKAKGAKAPSTKGVNSIKNSLAAFFSKRKNEQRFGAGVNGHVTPNGVNSYSLWPSAPFGDNSTEAGSASSSPITLASNPNIRLLAGAIPRPQCAPSPRTRRAGDQLYGMDYSRRDSMDTMERECTSRKQSERGAFVSNPPLYWWHKDKTDMRQTGNGCDFVEV